MEALAHVLPSLAGAFHRFSAIHVPQQMACYSTTRNFFGVAEIFAALPP
jgi:hypothetical protein